VPFVYGLFVLTFFVVFFERSAGFLSSMGPLRRHSEGVSSVCVRPLPTVSLGAVGIFTYDSLAVYTYLKKPK